MAKVFGWGCLKYQDRNWEKGYKWGLSFAAMERHQKAFWRREERDPESGLRHLAHSVWHGLVLLTFAMRNLGTDSRGVKCEPDPIPESVVRDFEEALLRDAKESMKASKKVKKAKKDKRLV